MLDEHTRNHCLHVQKMAEREGLSLFELLEQAGLLVSDDKRLLIQQGTMAFVITQLEAQQHTILANLGGGQTVTGAVNGCVKFLEMFTKGLK